MNIDLILSTNLSQAPIWFQFQVWFEDRIARWRQEEGLSPDIKHVSELKSTF